MIPSFLKGEAILWWDAHEVAVTTGTVAALANWAMFETELKHKFEPRDFTFEVRTKIHKLFQNKKNVQEFTFDFRKLSILITDMMHSEIVHTYVTHLNYDIATEVMWKNPATLVEAITEAQHAEDLLRRFSKGRKQDIRPAWTPSQQYYGNGSSSNYSGPTPMDLSNVGMANPYGKGKGKGKGKPPGQGFPQPQFQKLTKAERDYLSQNKGCFRCRQLGHWAKNCTVYPNAQQGPAMPRYPIYPAQPVYTHQVSRRALKVNNIQTMTESPENEDSQ
jgi:hypothetical protein